MLVALAAAPSSGQRHQRVGIGKIGKQRFAFFRALIQLGAQRQFQHQVLPLAAVALTAHAALPVLRLVQTLETEVIQAEQPADAPSVHTAAVSAVAAVRPALGHEFLAAEAQTAVAALARLHRNDGFIHKSHTCPFPAQGRGILAFQNILRPKASASRSRIRPAGFAPPPGLRHNSPAAAPASRLRFRPARHPELFREHVQCENALQVRA